MIYIFFLGGGGDGVEWVHTGMRCPTLGTIFDVNKSRKRSKMAFFKSGDLSLSRFFL